MLISMGTNFSETGDQCYYLHLVQGIAATSHQSAGPKPCEICALPITPQARQNHVGQHILFKLRGVKETRELKTEVR
jgi:N-acetylglutamate synthase-like GNAT family acetyltransferase